MGREGPGEPAGILSLTRAFTVSKNVDEGSSKTLRAEALEDAADSEIFARINFRE